MRWKKPKGWRAELPNGYFADEDLSMARFALSLAPPSRLDDRPAIESLDDDAGRASLELFRLGWKEAWVESVLSRFPKELLACGGCKNTGDVIVLREVHDIDLVVIVPERTLLMVEIKTDGGDSARKAISQLAHNFDRALRIFGSSFQFQSVQTMICGSWTRDQASKARSTVAWEHLRKRGAEPTIVVHSGARIANGQRYLVFANTEDLSLGGRPPDPDYHKTRQRLQRLSSQLPHLPRGLKLDIRLFEGRIAVRVAAERPLRDEYLRSSPEASRPDEQFRRFLSIYESLSTSPGLAGKAWTGQTRDGLNLTPLTPLTNDFVGEAKMGQRLEVVFLSQSSKRSESLLSDVRALATELAQRISAA